MTTSYVFGDIFSYQNVEYIFLATTEDEVYAAKILSNDLTRKVEDASSKAEMSGNAGRNRALVYCYVILRSENFKNRAAFYGKTDCSLDMLSNKLEELLDPADLIAIKSEILDSRAISQKLKEAIEDIEV